MNVHSTAPTDPDAFLRWNEGRGGKRELVRGKVIEMMIKVTRWHADITSRLLIELGTRLDRRRFDVFATDFGLKTTDGGVRYPDVVVDRAGGGGKDLAVTEPVFVCEVLSPSTTGTDLVEKLAEYTGIPSVRNYLVLSQDEARAWLWSRRDARWTGPDEIAGADGTVSLPALDVTLQLGRLYPPALL